MKRLTLAALLVAVSAGTAQAAVRPGVYSNVCLFPEADDYGGYEIRLRVTGGRPTVVFWKCEGGCWDLPAKDVAVVGDALTFSAEDQSFDEKGKLVESTPHRYVAKLHGKRLALESPDDSSVGRVTLLPQEDYPPSDPRAPSKPPEGSMVDWPAPIRRCR